MTDAGVFRTYGNLRRPSSFGVFGFGLAASVAGFVLVVVTVLVAMLSNLLWAGLVFFVGALTLLPTRRSSRDGHTGYGRIVKRVVFRVGRRREVSVQGPAGSPADGSFRIPGVGASTRLVTHRDPMLGEVAFVHKPETHHWAAVLEVAPDGNALVDVSTHDRQVDWWAEFLSRCGDFPQVVGVQAVVDTAPDTGARLSRSISESRSRFSPEFSRAVMDTIAETFPARQAAIRSWVTVTFSSDKARGSTAEMLESFCNVLPTLIAALSQSGAGQAIRPMNAIDITDAMRVEFDPSTALDVERARQDGGTGLTWSQAGPSYWVPHLDHVVHDHCKSKSWQMVRPSSSVFTSDCLSKLLAPSSVVLRKRVAINYRPMDVETSRHEAEKAVNRAVFRSGQGRRLTASQAHDVSAAQAMEHEQARGDKMTRFSVVVTMTVREGEDFAAADSALEQMRATARLTMREALGCQSSAFLASLPLGLVMPLLAAIPPEIEQML